MMDENDVVVAAACRTPIGAFRGALSDVSAAQLAAITIGAALARAGAAPECVDEVIFGSVLTAGAGQNVARQAALAAGLPVTVPAETLNMVCGSGMKAVMDGARAIDHLKAMLVMEVQLAATVCLLSPSFVLRARKKRARFVISTSIILYSE